MTVTIGARSIGDGFPCFITYEAGPTHNGLASAKRLVQLAAEAGADAVKFQIVDPERLFADKNDSFPYDILVNRETGETKRVVESQYAINLRRVLKPDEWRELKRFSDSLGLAFFATALFDDEIDFLAELGCDSVKIASGDVNNFPFLRRAARSGMCVQLDTGNSTLGEIDRAVEVIRSEGNDRVIVHLCPSGYPARLDSINLRIIPTLKNMLPVPVAFSDHTPGWDMDVAAVTLGANMVEKTITLDRMTPSTEHIMSLEAPEMKKFVQVIRDVERALGTPRRILHAEEMARRRLIRRSMHLAEPARCGTKLRDVKIIFRRPGDGICGDGYEDLRDRAFRKDLPAGHKLSLGDFI